MVQVSSWWSCSASWGTASSRCQNSVGLHNLYAQLSSCLALGNWLPLISTGSEGSCKFQDDWHGVTNSAGVCKDSQGKCPLKSFSQLTMMNPSRYLTRSNNGCHQNLSWSWAMPMFDLFMTGWERLCKSNRRIAPFVEVGLEWVKLYYSWMDNTCTYIIAMCESLSWFFAHIIHWNANIYSPQW